MTAHVEEWRTVPGYPDYEVSDLGRVRRMLTVRVDAAGYPAVGLTRAVEGMPESTMARVHVLVALAFLGPRLNGDHVDHVNGVKADNCASNLEWVTQRENNRRAVALGLRKRTTHGERNGNSKLTDAVVVEIRRRRAAGESTLSISRDYGIHAATVSRVARGLRWAHVQVSS